MVSKATTNLVEKTEFEGQFQLRYFGFILDKGKASELAYLKGTVEAMNSVGLPIWISTKKTKLGTQVTVEGFALKPGQTITRKK